MLFCVAAELCHIFFIYYSHEEIKWHGALTPQLRSVETTQQGLYIFGSLY